MEALIIDLTHGGVKIAIELSKLNIFDNIHAYDLYNTIKIEEKKELDSYQINLIENKEKFEKFKNNLKERDKKDFLITYPVHSPIKSKDISLDGNIFKYDLTHHEVVKFILKKWKEKTNAEDIPIIEVTGVKGKTTTVSMIKHILKEYDSLILSSLGACLYKNRNKIMLKRNISITPASILETINLAKEIANTKYKHPNETISKNTPQKKKFNYKSAIFESSLGVSGIGSVGILTNIIENYKIANNTYNAKKAKKQVFNCDIIVIDYDTLIKFYYDQSKLFENKINTFKIENYNLYEDLDDKNRKENNYSENDKNDLKENQVNLIGKNIEYGLDKTKIHIQYNNLKTLKGEEISGTFNITTFAPGKHHVLNVLAAITCSLTLEITPQDILEGLLEFKGVKGRSSQKIVKGFRIIEEINPGLNVKSIKKSINTIKNLSNYVIIIGGKYGVTCEEIDEKELSKVLNTLLNTKNIELILVDELGKSLKDKMKNNVKFMMNPLEAQNIAIKNKKNVLFIYRSNYSQAEKR
jgi:UDP-N-acetylmuramyl pentapeptide synthase